MNPLFVGIDVSSRQNVAFLMRPDGSKFCSFSVDNNLGGAKILSKRIVSALVKESLTNVVIGIEATSVYGDKLICFLREDGAIASFLPKFHILNLKQVKKFKDSFPDLPQNDFVDAFVIADNLKFNEVIKCQFKRALALTARKLVRLVFALLKDNRLYIAPEVY